MAFTVPVFVCEKWRTFVVDTGGDYCIIHPSLTNGLTEEPSRSILLEHGSSRGVTFFSGPSMFVSNVWTRPESVMCPGSAPFSVWEERNGERVDGVLGLDVLTNFAVLLDFTKRSATFSTNLPYPLRCGLPLNVTPNGKYVFPATLANRGSIEVALDTACEGGVSLNPDDWIKAFPNGPMSWRLVTLTDCLGETFETQETRLPELQIGSEIYTNVQCPRGYNTEMPSVIGLDLLRDHKVIIDYPGRTINLRRVSAK